MPNAGYRLKPGMYSRVQLTISTRDDAITVPRNALVDLAGQTGVFVAAAAEKAEGTRGGGGGGQAVMTAKFIPVEVGIRDGDAIEITKGLDDGARVITTGANALKDGDRIVAASEAAAGDARDVGRPPAVDKVLRRAQGRQRSLRGAADEHSASSYRASDHDVHAVGRRDPDRRPVAGPPAGRPDARRLVPEHHGARRATAASGRSRWKSS